MKKHSRAFGGGLKSGDSAENPLLPPLHLCLERQHLLLRLRHLLVGQCILGTYSGRLPQTEESTSWYSAGQELAGGDEGEDRIL